MIEELILIRNQCTCQLWNQTNCIDDEDSYNSILGHECSSSFSEFNGELSMLEEGEIRNLVRDSEQIRGGGLAILKVLEY